MVRACSEVTTETSGPWPRSLYSVPLTAIVLGGLTATAFALQQPDTSSLTNGYHPSAGWPQTSAWPQGTVARTYRELESARLVTTRREGGTRVTTELPERPTPILADEIQRQVTAFVGQARRLGATDQQIRSAVDTALDPASSASTNQEPTPTHPRPATSTEHGDRR